MSLFRYLKGYVHICVRGKQPEKWINIVIRRGIPIWNLQRKQDGSFTLCIPKNAYRTQTKTICAKTGCQTRVLRRRGLIYDVRKSKHRKTLVITGILACAVICFLNQLTWSVEVIPGTQTSDQDIAFTRQWLLQNGIRPGVFLDTVDTRQVAWHILHARKGLCWVQVRREGTRFFVEIERGTYYSQEGITSQKPCNLIADKDFEMVKCTVYSGIPRCAPGDVIHKGDLLVSGIEEGVPARADIQGKTWYSARVEVTYEAEQVMETGKIEYNKSLFFFGLQIPLPGKNWLPWYKGVSRENSSQNSTLTYWALPGGASLPMGVQTTCRKETKLTLVSMNDEEAVEYARLQAARLLDEKIPDEARILSTVWRITRDEDGTAHYEITAECLERINVKIVDKL